jgi:hypothetical protein
MPAYIPIPEGLTIPEEPEFELPVTFEMRDGQLYALAVDGMPLPEGEMEDEEMEDGGEDDMNFMAAVERGMSKRS